MNSAVANIVMMATLCSNPLEIKANKQQYMYYIVLQILILISRTDTNITIFNNKQETLHILNLSTRILGVSKSPEMQ